MSRAGLLALLLGVACAAQDHDESQVRVAAAVPPCHASGCSGQVCTNQSDIATTCEWLPEYACYRTARCEPQQDGQCGWTQTPELLACIENARAQ